MPEISVIVPVYNVGAWLLPCLESIQKQDFTDYELILVDDGSTDDSGAIVDRFAKSEPRAHVIHQSNQGLSAARNAGIDLASGRYIAFVDADDIVHPTYLSRLHEACDTTGAGMAVCAVEDVNEDGTSTEPASLTLPVEAGTFAGRDLLVHFYSPDGTYYTVAWNKLYRAEIWKTLRYPTGRLHEDDAVSHLLYWNCETVACLDAPLYQYRLRNGSICHSSIVPSAFDAVDFLAARYHFYEENNVDRVLLDKSLGACWHRYLFLCAKVSAEPTPELMQRITQEQPTMSGLIAHLPTCKSLKMAEKLSAARWSMMNVESLCRYKAN